MLSRKEPDRPLGTGDITSENLEIVSEHGDIVLENRPLVRDSAGRGVEDAVLGLRTKPMGRENVTAR